MKAHLGHKASREGLNMALNHALNVYILGLCDFNGAIGSYIIISLFHYLFLADGLD